MTAAERGSARKRVGCADHRSAARCHALLCPFPSPGASVASAADRRRVPCRIKGNKGIHIMCIHTFRVRIRRYGWMHRSLVSARRCPVSGYGRRSRLAPCIHTGSGSDSVLDRALQATGYTPGVLAARRRCDSADRELGAPVIGRPGGRCAWWFDRECSRLSGFCSGQRSPREAGWDREARSADQGRPRVPGRTTADNATRQRRGYGSTSRSALSSSGDDGMSGCLRERCRRETCAFELEQSTDHAGRCRVISGPCREKRKTPLRPR